MKSNWELDKICFDGWVLIVLSTKYLSEFVSAMFVL